MNILFLSDVDLDIVGGSQESMKIIMNGLKDNYNFKIITPKSMNKNNYNVIEYTEYKDFLLRTKSIKDIIKISNYIRKSIIINNINIIHVQMPSTMAIVGLLKLLGLIKRDIKIIYTDRGVLNKYGKIPYNAIKLFSKNFENIIVTTNNNKNLYINENRKYNSKIKVIYNTAGEIFEKYCEKYELIQKKKLQINNDEIAVMFAGRMSVDKNWPLALEIIKELSHNNKIKFIIAIGSDKSKKSIEECEKFIHQILSYVNEQRVVYYIDASLEKMNDLYYASDIFMLTSITESFGRTAVEAMSRKNIVFGTRVDGLKEVIGYEENLYNDKNEAIYKINKIIGSDAIVKKEKEKFFTKFIKEFSLEKNLNSHKELYKEIINNKQ